MWLGMLLISAFWYFFAWICKPSEREQTAVPSQGVIECRIDRHGQVRFYVQFLDADGNEHIARSNYVWGTKGKYHAGDPIPIRYYFSKKGIPHVIIDDPTLKTANSRAKIWRVLFLIISGGFACAALLTIIKSLLC